MDNNDLRLAYQIRQLIDETLDNFLLPQIEELVENSHLRENKRMGNAQFSNLQNVARETESVQVIFNWLRYQIGRQSAWRENNFGQQLLSNLRYLERYAIDIVRVLPGEQNMDDQSRRRLERQVWLTLIRQYAGQLRRFYLGAVS